MMAGVLGLHISANERYGITATNPTTGESCKLMHQCEPPFKNGNEGELFASDMDSLLEFEKFIIRQTQERIGETREMEYLEESESVLFNYIRITHRPRVFNRYSGRQHAIHRPTTYPAVRFDDKE